MTATDAFADAAGSRAGSVGQVTASTTAATTRRIPVPANAIRRTPPRRKGVGRGVACATVCAVTGTASSAGLVAGSTGMGRTGCGCVAAAADQLDALGVTAARAASARSTVEA
jgi:hypothetical protein